MDKNFVHTATILIVLWSAGLPAGSARIRESNETAQAHLSSVPYLPAGSERNDSWDPNSLGNHRVVIDVSRRAGAAAVHIPWRRRDRDPQGMRVILVDARTNRRIDNIHPVEINREFGDFIFEPVTAPGEYYMYYMPYEMTGRHYPTVRYLEPEHTADAAWLTRSGYVKDGFSKDRWSLLPRAKVVKIQSIDEFNSFYPMEVIATARETRELLAKVPGASYILFPEDRKYPIRMTEDLPLRWIEKGLRDRFEGNALRGEFYAFQIGVYAAGRAIRDIDVRFSDMRGPGDSLIDASALRCFNVGGVDLQGRNFEKICPVEMGKIRALWLGVDVPENIAAGRYNGGITITPAGAKPTTMRFILNVRDELLADAGDSQPWRHSRLRWLDSKIGLDDEIVKPFTPLVVRGNTIVVS